MFVLDRESFSSAIRHVGAKVSGVGGGWTAISRFGQQGPVNKFIHFF